MDTALDAASLLGGTDGEGCTGDRTIATHTRLVGLHPSPVASGVPLRVRFRVSSDLAPLVSGRVVVESEAGPTCTGTVDTGACSLVFPAPGEYRLQARFLAGGSFAASESAELAVQVVALHRPDVPVPVYWHEGEPDRQLALRRLDCSASGEFCAAVGYLRDCSGPTRFIPAILHRAGAGDWRLQTLAEEALSLQTVQCTGSGFCLALGERSQRGAPDIPMLLRSTDGGAGWEPLAGTVPLEQPELLVSCPDADACLVVERQALAGGAVNLAWLRGAGERWEPLAAPAPLQAVSGIHCPSASRCLLAADGALYQYLSRDGIVDWVRLALPEALTLSQLQCPGERCYALDRTPSPSSINRLWLSEGDGPWTLTRTLPRSRRLACSNDLVCVLARRDEYQLSSDGWRHWQPLTDPDLPSPVDMDCTLSGDCLVLSADSVHRLRPAAATRVTITGLDSDAPRAGEFLGVDARVETGAAAPPTGTLTISLGGAHCQTSAPAGRCRFLPRRAGRYPLQVRFRSSAGLAPAVSETRIVAVRPRGVAAATAAAH